MKLSSEQQAVIVSRYESGETRHSLSHSFDVSDDLIQKILRMHDVHIRLHTEAHAARRMLTPSQEDEICQRFKTGTRQYVLGKEFHVDPRIILACILRHGIPNHDRRHHTLNEGAFDPPMTEEKAYWLGMLMADGHIARPRGHRAHPGMELKLQKRDKAHVEQLRIFLDTSYPVKAVPTLDAVTLRIASARLVAALSIYGVTHNKTLEGRAQGLEMNRHFWRGMIDGDGHISIATYAG